MGKTATGEVIKIVKDGKPSKQGYTKYKTTLEDNQNFILSLDLEDPVPVIGDNITAEESIGKVYVLLKINTKMSKKSEKKSKEKKGKKGGKNKSSKKKEPLFEKEKQLKSKKTTITSSTNYWNEKYKYEVDVRDAAIRKQAQFQLIAQFYVKPGETMTNTPKRLNAALAKYKEVFGEDFAEGYDPGNTATKKRTRRTKAEIEAEKNKDDNKES